MGGRRSRVSVNWNKGQASQSHHHPGKHRRRGSNKRKKTNVLEREKVLLRTGEIKMDTFYLPRELGKERKSEERGEDLHPGEQLKPSRRKRRGSPRIKRSVRTGMPLSTNGCFKGNVKRGQKFCYKTRKRRSGRRGNGSLDRQLPKRKL